MTAAVGKIKAARGRVVQNVPLITLAELAKVEGGADPDSLFGDCISPSFCSAQL